MWEGPFDKACRYLLKLDPAALLAWLLGVRLLDMAFIRWIDTRRLPYPGQPDRTCDTVAHVERIDDNHRPWAIVVEFNIEPDAVMFGRLLGYLGPLWIEEKPSKERGDRFEIGAIVVNLTGVGTTSRTSAWPDAGIEFRARVRECNLATMSAERVLQQIADGTAPRSVLPWIPLMQGGGELGIIDTWKELATAEPQQQRRTDYGGLALVFADAANCWDQWKLALKEWNVFESRQVKEWQDMARRDQQLKTRTEAVLEVLSERFGSLPNDVPVHLKAIDDADVLKQLLQKAVRADTLEEFRKQIPNGSQNGSHKNEQ